jgi:hypothetical protein
MKKNSSQKQKADETLAKNSLNPTDWNQITKFISIQFWFSNEFSQVPVACNAITKGGSNSVPKPVSPPVIIYL